MASIKLTLDTRAARKDGTLPVKVTVSHRGKTSHISLGIYLRAHEWNKDAQRVQGRGDKDFLNDQLSQRFSYYYNKLVALRTAGKLKGCAALDVRDMLVADDNEEITTLSAWYQEFTQKHTNARTREIYKCTWAKVMQFEPARFTHLLFEDITKDWLDRFFVWLASTGCRSINARNIHIRNIRAVFNDAIDNEITTAYPFRRFKIKNEQTRKRNLKAAALLRFFETPCKPHQQKYFDCARLMFLLIGVNAVDILTADAAALNNGRFEYRRSKTGKLYSVKIEPEAAEIIRKYKGRRRLLSFAEGCENYKNWAKRLNKNLKEAMPAVTSYYMRHSWATIAAELDIPDDTIAMALGHAGINSTTNVYIERNRRKVDAANRRVIDFVFYGKK